MLIAPDKLPKKPKIEQIEKEEEYFEPIINTGGTVNISFESGGRFGNPSSIYMSDLKGRHINDIMTTKEDRILETLVSCLNECVIEPKGFDISNLTSEEFLELMIGMKLSFDTPILEYRWIHSCQDNLAEKDKKASLTEIDLRTIKMTSIEESDEKIREFFKTKFNELSENQFKNYIYMKYKEKKNITIDDELKTIKIREPISIPDGEYTYEFNVMRIKYLIEAQKISSKEFDNKIRVATNQPIFNMTKEDSQAFKEEKIESIKRDKLKAFINYSKALCLVSKTDSKGFKTFFTTTDEKIKEDANISRKVYIGYMDALDKIIYGVNQDIELVCDICEDKIPEWRNLRRIITPLHLLPISNSETDPTKRKQSISSGLGFYF